MKIITHVELDIDAASSAALALLVNDEDIKNVIFINSDTSYSDFCSQVSEDFIALDINLSGKGIKGTEVLKDRKVKVLSAFSTYLKTLPVKYQEAFERLADFIDKEDTKEETITHNSILTVFRAIKAETSNDKEVLECWYLILRGIYNNYMAYERARIETSKAVVFYPTIAYINNPKENMTAKLILNKGYNFVIYRNKNNIGVLISGDVPRSVVKGLKEALPDWFHHPAGFLSCWGSRTAPKSVPYDITPKELADLLNSLM